MNLWSGFVSKIQTYLTNLLAHFSHVSYLEIGIFITYSSLATKVFQNFSNRREIQGLTLLLKESILVLVLKWWRVEHCFKVFFIECKWVSTLASTHIGLRKPSIDTLEEISRVHLWRILNLRLDDLVSLSLGINCYLSLILNLLLMIHLWIWN